MTARAAFGRFGAGLLALAVLRVLAGLVAVPPESLGIVNGLLAVAFIGVPVWAIAQAARAPWTPRTAVALLVGGVALQALATVAAKGAGGLGGLVLLSVAQGALQVWCVGLGALLATLIRERNILIPVAVFLAIYDLFLVVTPVGFTQTLMKAAPAALANVGHAIPQVQATGAPKGATPGDAGYIGPADLVFLGAYFVALARFGMRLGETVLAMVPTLALYLLVVLGTGVPLPALLPIGALSRSGSIAASSGCRGTSGPRRRSSSPLGLGLLVWGATRPAPRGGPSSLRRALGGLAPLRWMPPSDSDPLP